MFDYSRFPASYNLKRIIFRNWETELSLYSQAKPKMSFIGSSRLEIINDNRNNCSTVQIASSQPFRRQSLTIKTLTKSDSLAFLTSVEFSLLWILIFACFRRQFPHFNPALSKDFAGASKSTDVFINGKKMLDFRYNFWTGWRIVAFFENLGFKESNECVSLFKKPCEIAFLPLFSKILQDLQQICSFNVETRHAGLDFKGWVRNFTYLCYSFMGYLIELLETSSKIFDGCTQCLGAIVETWRTDFYWISISKEDV